MSHEVLVDEVSTRSSSTFEREPALDADGAPEPARPAPAPAPEEPMPARLGRYAVRSRLGAGGMGVVYLARDHELDRDVAVKVVRARSAGGASVHQQRLLREARAMARLAHPNVVTIHDVGVVDDTVFVAMERIQGTTLKAWLGAERRSLAEIRARLHAAARGLAAVHGAGLVHRDFKPANVLLGDDGAVKVADFGLVHPVADEVVDGEESPSALASGRLTSDGGIVGTLGYISPEQLRGAPVDARSDIFSFCASLYEAVHGSLPFAGRTRAELLASIEGGVPRAAERGAARRLHAIAVRGLAAEPGRRWPSMDAIVDALEVAPVSRWRATFAAIAALVALALVVGPRFVALPCPDRAAILDGLWGDAEEAAIAASLRRSPAEIGEGGVARALAALDRYAVAYADGRAETCVARRAEELTPADLDARDACLGERQVAFAALVELLETRGVALAAEAVELVERLPRVRECLIVDHADEGHEAAASAGRAAQIRALCDELAVLDVLVDAEQIAAATTAAAGLRPRIEALDAPALQARMDRCDGRLAHLERDDARARERLRSSLQISLRHGLDEAAARSAIHLMEVCGPNEGDLVEAYDQIAAAMLERFAVADRELDRHRRYAAADSLVKGAHMLEAWPYFVALVDDLRADPASSLRSRLMVFNRAAFVASQIGEIEAKATMIDEVLADTRDFLGPSHPETRGLLINAAEVRMQLGDFEAARSLGDEAVAACDEVGGEDLAAALWIRGIIRERQGDTAGELVDLQAASRICGEPKRCRSTVRLRVANSLAVVLDQQGAYDDARAALRGVLDAESDLPRAEILEASLTLGDVELHDGDLAAARALFGEALPGLREELGETSFFTLYAERALALIDLAEGDAAAARARLEALLRVQEPRGSEGPWELAATLFALAKAIDVGAGAADRQVASAHAERAAAIYRELGPGFADALAEVEAWLAGDQTRAE